MMEAIEELSNLHRVVFQGKLGCNRLAFVHTQHYSTNLCQCNSNFLQNFKEAIDGFHRITFTSNCDVNVEIGGHFGDQGHIMAIEATV